MKSPRKIIIDASLVERFWAMVDQRGPDECWPWTGCTTTFGHGFIGGLCRTNLLAHRVSYAIFKGSTDGVWILHRCDNPRCVNPAHLFVGTPTDNMNDMVAKGRCRAPAGEQNGYSKLTQEQVNEIRCAPGPQHAIAARFGIRQGHVSRIKSGTRWAKSHPSKDVQTQKEISSCLCQT